MSVQLLSEYFEFLGIEKGLSENTVDAYKNDLMSFLDFCSKRGVVEIKDIERSDINSYILELRDLHYSP